MLRHFLILPICLVALVGCANEASFNPPQAPEKRSSEEDKTFATYPLLWEKQQPGGKAWSQHVFETIQNQAPELIQGSKDVTAFCPRYYSLATNERVNFWGLLISAMAKFESSFDPTSRMHETTLGIDAVTGKPVYSEGLLQLSYQDVRPYPFCEFNWPVDKSLKATDPGKTILDPFINLSCGVKILARQVKSRDRITVSSGAYWAVIKLNGRTNKIEQIATLTKKMPGCM